MRQRLAILGSTGSIGEQTINIAHNYSDLFEVVTLTSNNNWKRMAEQARRLMPDSVVIGNKEHYLALKNELQDIPVKVYAGQDAIAQVASSGAVDTVVNAIVGYAGLAPTISALTAGKKLALANKESLVIAGELVMSLSERYNAPIIPVDSEHSAIFQCLVGEKGEIDKVILTASGGPFLNTSKEEMLQATAEQALAHPNWKMGAKITVDSATMLNKGFEVIEAKWLFGLRPDQIEVIVHPQSVIHSMVEFCDGAIKAQLGVPDMHLPIQYALTFPYRLPLKEDKFNFRNYASLDFIAPDLEKFPALGYAFSAMEEQNNACCILNAANEVAVESFLQGSIKFGAISTVLEAILSTAERYVCDKAEKYKHCDAEARRMAKEYVESIL